MYLQLTKVLSTAVGPTASSGDENSDDGTAEVVQVISAEQADCESSRPAQLRKCLYLQVLQFPSQRPKPSPSHMLVP